MEERGVLDTDALFISVENKPFHARSIQDRLRHYGMQTGVSKEVTVSPHAFRRTFCRLKVEAGTNIFVLQRLTGHQSLEPLTNENATIDHVYPLSQSYGGVNIVENIVSVCRSCNSSKASDHVADFYRRSDKFTTELFQAFARSYGSRLLGRELSELEGRHMARNLIEEAEELRRNAERVNE